MGYLEHFRELDAKGLMMFGQMTAGSWIYIGTQGILQGTYETFAALAKKHFGGSLKGRLVVSGGLGGMGGAQPLAATMNGGVFLGADVDRSRIEKRLRTRYIDRMTDSVDEGIEWSLQARRTGTPVSIGVVTNIVCLLEVLHEREITPDVLTDQTSAHDPLNGYVPYEYFSKKWSDEILQSWLRLRSEQPNEYIVKSYSTMADHLGCMLDLQKRGAITFDYGNNLRGHVNEAWHEKSWFAAGSPGDLALQDGNPFKIPGFVPEYIRPLFCEGSGPFRWAALSGEASDIRVTDQAVLDTFPQEEHLCRWIRMAGEKVAFQGLPARICWLKYGQRAKMGLIFNRLVREKKLSAPIVIGRDHLDCGSVASPNRETEAMKDGSDAVADWPILNALSNTACGASWVSVHHGGGVGMGYSIHAGQVIVCDGTPEADRRIQRVLTADPALGVMRHADAGYELAQEVAREKGVDLGR